MLLYVPPQSDSPTAWFGGAVTLARYAGAGTSWLEEAVTPGSYVDLGPGDVLVIPVETPFAVQAGQDDPAFLSALMIFPSGPPAAPNATY